MADGEGRNAWFAAFQNPTSLGRRQNRLRDCDRITAEVLWKMGAVTCDLGVWRGKNVGDTKGSLCYMNGDSSNGSVMLRAIVNKNVSVVNFLCQKRGVVTDRDYLELKRRGLVETRLIPMVVEVLNESVSNTTNDSGRQLKSKLKCLSAKSWNPHVDWSFPPTWKVGMILCQNCGLPADIFRSHIVPFLSRDWFYSKRQLCGDIPARLGASMGERVRFCRQLRWIETGAVR